VREIPGNHMTILYEPNVSVLARKLTECLDEIYAREAAVSQAPSRPSRP
jgi:thioesterase domain-containing protein